MNKPFLGFWSKLPKPIVGLAPMDGVTDLVCRTIMVRHGQPDVIFTEFTHAEGLLRAPQRLLQSLEYTESERPIVAQIYGHRPEHFYRATHVVCELGFDGVDLNMGCPARKVVSRNCGAGLIRVPDLAREIIGATRQAILDWADGQRLQDLDLPNKLIDLVARANETRGIVVERKRIPYSIKTRIGYDTDVIESWIEMLLQEKPAVISIHGRTLKQMYKGSADWEAIKRAAQYFRGTGTLILGNGDITNLNEAAERILSCHVDGVLLGRGTLGNPWIFRNKELLRKKVLDQNTQTVPDLSVSPLERIQMSLEHAQLLQDIRGDRIYSSIKRHLKGYLSRFRGAAILRRQAMLTRNFDELSSQLNPFLQKPVQHDAS